MWVLGNSSNSHKRQRAQPWSKPKPLGPFCSYKEPAQPGAEPDYLSRLQPDPRPGPRLALWDL
jgi:hypothetical protein